MQVQFGPRLDGATHISEQGCSYSDPWPQGQVGRAGQICTISLVPVNEPICLSDLTLTDGDLLGREGRIYDTRTHTRTEQRPNVILRDAVFSDLTVSRRPGSNSHSSAQKRAEILRTRMNVISTLSSNVTDRAVSASSTSVEWTHSLTRPPASVRIRSVYALFLHSSNDKNVKCKRRKVFGVKCILWSRWRWWWIFCIQSSIMCRQVEVVVLLYFDLVELSWNGLNIEMMFVMSASRLPDCLLSSWFISFPIGIDFTSRQTFFFSFKPHYRSCQSWFNGSQILYWYFSHQFIKLDWCITVSVIPETTSWIDSMRHHGAS